MDDVVAMLTELDAWCKKRGDKITRGVEPYVMAGGDLNAPDYRLKLGEHRAYSAVRSYIHGVRAHLAGDGQ